MKKVILMLSLAVCLVACAKKNDESATAAPSEPEVPMSAEPADVNTTASPADSDVQEAPGMVAEPIEGEDAADEPIAESVDVEDASQPK